MQCFNGIQIQSKNQIVPCQQCMACRINKGRIWTSRILQEQHFTTKRSYFATLTIDPENMEYVLDDDSVPHETLRKKPFLQWVSNINREIPFRYYAVGEYGTDSGRPHYHMAVFPENDGTIEQILSHWKKGFTSYSELTAQTARYLAHYTTKKLTSDSDGRLKGNQEPEFRASSKRPPLGAACVDSLYLGYSRPKMRRWLEKHGDISRTITFDRRSYPLGPWALKTLRKKLGIPQLHRDRQDHEQYNDTFPLEEAEQCPETHATQEARINGQKKQGFYRGKGRKI